MAHPSSANAVSDLPIEDALPALRDALAGRTGRRAGRAARRRQDHPRAARPPRRALAARRRQDHPARAAPPRRPRRGRAHGRDPRRARRRDGRPAGPPRLEGLRPHPDRGRHRGRLHPHDPRRPRTDGHRRGALRRVPRALASTPISASPWRSTPRARLREDLRILVMSATLDGARVAALLGDAPVVASRGPRLPGRDPLLRTATPTAASRTWWPTPSCGPCGPIRARSWPSCRARARSAGSRRCSADARRRRHARSRPSTAR